MKFSVGNAARKWSCDISACDQRTIARLAVAVLVLWTVPAQAYLSGRVPLPKARPAEAPRIEQSTSAPKPGDTEADKPAAEAPAAATAPPPPTVSACRLALDESIAIAPSIPDIKGPGACGGPDMVHLEAVILPDKTRVPLKPGGIMRCSMATAIADWIRIDMAPLATGLGTKLSEVDNFDSFDCRGRNRVVGAKMSEHGRANALDVRALKFANGQSIALTDRTTPRDQREKVLLSVCSRFSTVLGPGSDGYHEDHIHLDLAERRGNYKICQWEVWDPMPQVAPLMPEVRPDEAPPRAVADAKAGDTGTGDGNAPAEAKPVGGKPTDAAPAAEAAAPEPDSAPAAAEPAPQPKAAKPVKPRKRRAPPSPFSFLR
jgi:hypothetical protein